MAEPPTGLQLDLLTVVERLERIRDQWAVAEAPSPALRLLMARVLEHDLPRLRGHLDPSTLGWWNTEARLISVQTASGPGG